MFKKISLLALTSAALAFALTSCVNAPVSLVAPSLTGVWNFAGLPVATTATIDGNDVTVTVGNGDVAHQHEGGLRGGHPGGRERYARRGRGGEHLHADAGRPAADAVVVSVHESVEPPALGDLTAKT